MKDKIWESNNQELDELIKEIKLKNPELTFFYDWSYNPKIELYLKRLMVNSYNANDDEIFKSRLNEYIHIVEHFFAKAIEKEYIIGENYEKIMNSFDNGFREIRFLPKDQRNFYGNSHDDVIEINPEINSTSKRPNLTVEETTMMYMFREMGNKILKVANMDLIEKYCLSFKKIMKEKGKEYKGNIPLGYIQYGFLLIESALAQELAEDLTYYAMNKERPENKVSLEFESIISSNFDYYEIIEEPTVQLGRTLRGCGVKESSSKDVLHNMIMRCLKSDSFGEEIISEYYLGDARLYLDLFFTLQNMGNVLNEKYSTFTKRQMPKTSNSVRTSLQNIKGLTSRNKIYLEYPEEGIKKVEFDKYIDVK